MAGASVSNIGNANIIGNTIHAKKDVTISINHGDTHVYQNGITREPFERLLSTLAFPEIDVRYESIDEPQGDTFRWILNPPSEHADASESSWDSFMQWLEDEEPIYWISGKPASGKSTLTKHLVDKLSVHRNDEGSAKEIVSFWFWESGVELQRTMKGFLRSVLWQLLKRMPEISESYSKIDPGFCDRVLTTKKLIAFLKHVLVEMKDGIQNLLLFVDGPDEAGHEAEEILNLLQDLTKEHVGLKVCISSRHEPLFSRSLSRYPKLRLEDLNARDINSYIQQSFLIDRRVAEIDDINGQVLQDLQYKLRSKAQGVFLWVVLAVRSLLRGIENYDTSRMLQRRLDALPNDLNKLFTQTMARNRIDEEHYHEDTAFYLSLILHSEMSFVQFALAVQHTVRPSFIRPPFDWNVSDLHLRLRFKAVLTWMETRSAGLLNLAQPDDFMASRHDLTRIAAPFGCSRVQFLHRTVRTYLLDTDLGKHLIASCPYSEQEICKICSESGYIVTAILRPIERRAVGRTVSLFRNIPIDLHCSMHKDYSLSTSDLIAVADRLVHENLVHTEPWSHFPALKSDGTFPLRGDGSVDPCLYFVQARLGSHVRQALETCSLRNDPAHLDVVLAHIVRKWNDLQSFDYETEEFIEYLLERGASVHRKMTLPWGESLSGLYLLDLSMLRSLPPRLQTHIYGTARQRDAPLDYSIWDILRPNTFAAHRTYLFGTFNLSQIFELLAVNGPRTRDLISYQSQSSSEMRSASNHSVVELFFKTGAPLGVLALYRVQPKDSTSLVKLLYAKETTKLYALNGWCLTVNARSHFGEILRDIKRRTQPCSSAVDALLRQGKDPDQIRSCLEYMERGLLRSGLGERKLKLWKQYVFGPSMAFPKLSEPGAKVAGEDGRTGAEQFSVPTAQAPQPELANRLRKRRRRDSTG